MKYGKSGKGYFIVVAKMGDKGVEESSVKDPLAKYVEPERHVSFEEAGFEVSKIGGKDTWLPSGEASEKFSNEETSKRIGFQSSGKDKFNAVIVDSDGKVVDEDKVKDMQDMPAS